MDNSQWKFSTEASKERKVHALILLSTNRLKFLLLLLYRWRHLVGKSRPNELENGGKNDRKIIFKIFCGTLGAFPLWISQFKTKTSILVSFNYVWSCHFDIIEIGVEYLLRLKENIKISSQIWLNIQHRFRYIFDNTSKWHDAHITYIVQNAAV